ncbi:betaine aldehyde dehydrogenase [Escherichia coli]|uniref:Betaine aldehyde dehydrogenase n=1 Tax=Escherichia coli TaxID=562 RepID=A0A377DHI5_ECOLX|nr:betaine aldehyde dehydrogenase [Escherichia coli]
MANSAASSLKEVTMELGGKSPLIVFDDADLDLAADIAMMANFFSSVRCVPMAPASSFRRNAKPHLSRKFWRALSAFARATFSIRKLTSARWSASRIAITCCAISPKAKRKARAYCAAGDVLKGDGFDNGAWVAPTVFTDCSDDMTIVREEIFGPVMSILTYESEDEVIRRANDTDYGLAAGIVTADLNRAHRVIHQLEAGICWINTWGESPAEMPVGGYKHSGIGRENGVMTLQSYTQVKSIQVEMAKFQSIF